MTLKCLVLFSPPASTSTSLATVSFGIPAKASSLQTYVCLLYVIKRSRIQKIQKQKEVDQKSNKKMLCPQVPKKFPRSLQSVPNKFLRSPKKSVSH